MSKLEKLKQYQKDRVVLARDVKALDKELLSATKAATKAKERLAALDVKIDKLTPAEEA
jgi:hypothetical protein